MQNSNENELIFSSLRLSSVLPGNGRVLEQDIVLSGYRVPAKASRGT